MEVRGLEPLIPVCKTGVLPDRLHPPPLQLDEFEGNRIRTCVLVREEELATLCFKPLSHPFILRKEYAGGGT